MVNEVDHPVGVAPLVVVPANELRNGDTFNVRISVRIWVDLLFRIS